MKFLSPESKFWLMETSLRVMRCNRKQKGILSIRVKRRLPTMRNNATYKTFARVKTPKENGLISKTENRRVVNQLFMKSHLIKEDDSPSPFIHSSFLAQQAETLAVQARAFAAHAAFFSSAISFTSVTHHMLGHLVPQSPYKHIPLTLATSQTRQGLSTRNLSESKR